MDKKDERIPHKFLLISALSFGLGFLINPLIGFIGIGTGIYMVKKYPKKKIHGIMSILLNLIVLLYPIIFFSIIAGDPLSIELIRMLYF
jgi:hypothetical protein